MYSLQTFDLHEMLRCGKAVRAAAQQGTTMEEAAQAVVRSLYDECVDAAGTRECVLVRFYKTHRLGDLPPGLQAWARERGGDVSPDVQCLTLLASAGDQPDWNDRRSSRGHQAIPLPSEEIVEAAPMIAGLIAAMGLPIRSVIHPAAAEQTRLAGRTYNVFYVEEARGSPRIPAQEEFVIPFGVRSVFGFGGMLLSGGLYCVIGFTRVRVPPSAAERFRNIALDLRVALSTRDSDQVFAAPDAGT